MFKKKPAKQTPPPRPRSTSQSYYYPHSDPAHLYMMGETPNSQDDCREDSSSSDSGSDSSDSGNSDSGCSCD